MNKGFVLVVFVVLFAVTYLPADSLHLVKHSFIGEEAVPSGDFALALLFDREMNASLAAPFISLTAGGRDVPVKISAGDDEGASAVGGATSRTIVLSPAGTIEDGSRCVLKLAKGLSSSNKRYILGSDRSILFRTASHLSVVKLEGKTGGLDSGWINITFNNFVARKQLRKYITIRPYVYYWPSTVGRDNSKSRSFKLNGNFRPGRKYRIEISRALSSIDNEPMKSDRIFKVLMPPVQPSISFVEENRVVELKSRQLVHAAVVNVNELVCELIRVPPELVWVSQHRAINKGKHRLYLENHAYKKGETGRVLKTLTEWAKGMSSLTFPSPQKMDASGVTLQAERLFCHLDPYNSKAFSIPMTFRRDKSKGGTYFVRVGSGDGKRAASTPYRLYQVTDLGITVKESPEQYLVWVTSLNTGLPVADANIFIEDKDFRYDLGTTGQDGVLLIDRKKPHHVCTTDAGGDEALAVLENITDGVLLVVKDNDYAWVSLDSSKMDIPAGVNPDEGDNNSTVKVYAFTERGIYKPGDVVHWKCVLRDFRGGEPVLPKAGGKLTMKVIGPRGETIYSLTPAISGFGTANGVVRMKSFRPLGTYTMKFFFSEKASSDGVEVGRCTYELQEFRPPRHKVRIEFSHGDESDNRFVGVAVRDNYVTAKIQGLYYAGGPVRHGKVSWNIRYVGTEFKVKGEDEFEFKSYLLRSSPLLESGESILDESGCVDVRIPVSADVLSGTMGLEVEATVQDFDGRPATTTERYAQRPSVLVGTSKHNETIELGTATTLKAIVVAGGKRVNSGSVDVEVMRQSWLSVYKRDATGQVRWEGEDVFSRQFLAPIDIVNGVASFNFDFRNGGEYLVRFHYTDSGGRTYTGSTKYRVQGYYWSHEERERRERTISLAPDKFTYSTSEKVELAVQARRKAASYLLTIERDRVLEYKLVSFDKGQGKLSVDLKPDYAPNVYVSIIAPCERSRFPIHSSEADIFKPVVLFGACRINVRPASKTLSLDILPEPAETDPQPGDQMCVTVKVSDGLGRPVDAEIALCVVDEGILALTGYKTPDLSKLFAETLLPLSVGTFDLRNFLLPQSPFKNLSTRAFSGGGGLERTAGSKVQERKDFNPLAFWAPALTTGDDGSVSVGFKLPDTITAYRIYAVAVDKASLYGSSEILKKVVKPFYLEPGLPRFLVRGDKISLSVALFNKTDQKGTATLRIASPDNVKLDYSHGPFEIGPYASVMVPIKAKALKTGPAKFTFEARFSGGGDRVVKTIPVNSRLTMIDRVLMGRFIKSTKLVALLPPDLDDIPVDERQGISAVLTVTDNPLLRLSAGLKYLLQYPYGCIEQRSSGVMSLAGLYRLVCDNKIPGIQRKEVEKYLEPGIDKILALQLQNGAFSYWSGGSQAHAWGTVMAAQALHMAKVAGWDVPPERFTRLLKYLKKDAETFSQLKKMTTVEALTLYVLAAEKMADKKVVRDIAERTDRFNRQGLSVFLLAAKESGYLSDDYIVDKFQDLLSDSVSGQSDIGFDHRDFGSTSRELAFLLLLACELDMGDSAGAELADRIIARIGPEGRWISTHDTGWCLLALARFLGRSSGLSSAVTATIKQGSGTDRLEIEPGCQNTLSIPGKALLESPQLTISVPAKAALFYKLAYKIPLTEALRRKLAKGYTLTRSYNLPDGRKGPIRVGDIVEVRLDMEMPLKSEYLVLEDPLPAGLVAINSKLKTEPALPNKQDERNCYDYWSDWWAFVPQYVEMRDDRVMAFRNRSWGEPYRYVYYARAVASGAFTVPSAKVQEMYRPNRAGFSKAVTLVIKDAQK